MVSPPSKQDSTRILRVDLAEPLPAIDLADGDELWVLAMHQGVPVAHLQLPGPGRCAQPRALLAAIMGREAAPRVAFDRVRARLSQRIGPVPIPDPLSVSVVVCTHRRPDALARLLRALQELDPAPAEIVVVDNAPDREDSRRLVVESGARYVREDIKGLDVARATGIRVAAGEVIAFTDDDAIPPPGWLRNVPALFSDPLVGCATGPVLPYELATTAQRRHESMASLNRGLHARTEDWTTLDAGLAPELGVGANMMIRAAALVAPELMFPAELDAGTPSESGGDGYALYRLIADGWRTVYDPATYVFHEHRREAESFRRAVRGYGIGLGCWTATVLTRDRDVGALSLGLTPVSTLVVAMSNRIAGRADELEARAAWDLLRGLGLSPLCLRRARRAASRRPRDTSTPARADGLPRVSPTPQPQSLRGLSVSVVLDRADAATNSWLASNPDVVEVIAPDADGSPGYLAASAARAGGDIVLFWSSALEPDGDVIAGHISAHTDASAGIAVGDARTRCGDERLATRLHVRELSDRAHRVRCAAALTFLDVGRLNVSVPTRLLDSIGGLDMDFGEDCVREAALRACALGAQLRRAPAQATITTTATVRELMISRREEGQSLSRLADAHGAQAPILGRILAEYGRRTGTDRALGTELVVRISTPILAALERLRLRRQWAGVAERLLVASFRLGVAEARSPEALHRRDFSTIDVDSDERLALGPLGAHAATLRLAGEPVGFTEPLREAWLPQAAEELARAIDQRAWARLIEDVTRDYAADPDTLPTLTVLASSPEGACGLAGPGVSVEILRRSSSAQDFWRAADEAIRASATELVAVPLPGRGVSTAWATETRLALSGSSIGLAAGIGLADCWAAQPIRLLSERRGVRMGSAMAGMDYIAVRRSAYLELGGFNGALASVGHQTPPCQLLRRHLAAGGTAAWTVAPGIATDPAESRDGKSAAVYGAALSASAHAKDRHATGFLLIAALRLLAAVVAQRTVRDLLVALRDVLRFARGAFEGLTSGYS